MIRSNLDELAVDDRGSDRPFIRLLPIAGIEAGDLVFHQQIVVAGRRRAVIGAPRSRHRRHRALDPAVAALSPPRRPVVHSR